MYYLVLLDFTSALIGLGLAMLLWMRARLGRASWMLGLSLIPASGLSAVLGAGSMLGWTAGDTAFYALSCMLLFGAAGCIASSALKQTGPARDLKIGYGFLTAVASPAAVLIVALYLERPFLIADGEELQTLVALGPAGYAAAIYMLLVSVVTLANQEQMLHGSEEHVRWEMKFLVLGLALAFGATVYVASQILLYPPGNSYLSLQTLRIFPAIFLCSSLLIYQSWKRGSGSEQVSVSHSAIYSTITFLAIGGYLVVSSIVSYWASQYQHLGLPASPVIFLLSLVVLSTLFMATAFRHRAKVWIRKHLFSGRYDYRQFWIDATEQVRSIESPGLAGAALARLIQNAVGSLDISVWMRVRNSSNMRLIASRGEISTQLPAEFAGLADEFADLFDPESAGSVASRFGGKAPEAFVKATKASMLVPLISSRRLVGLVTVGADRSGRPFGYETREFLRVMAGHFANEFHKAELLSTLVEAREAEAFHTFSTFLLHDLKNFASTLSMISKNGARHRSNPDFLADAFQSVYEISEKMKQMCNNLRSFSPGLAANRRPADVNDIVRQVAESFESSLGERLQLKLDPLPLASVDAQEISGVLRNLILNAHEASPEGKSISVSTALVGTDVVISIADQGKGMSKEFLDNSLFQPFHTTKSDGLGIGLFQSKKIVEAHHGTIEVESAVGIGTVVRVLLRTSETPQTYRDTRGETPEYALGSPISFLRHNSTT